MIERENQKILTKELLKTEKFSNVVLIEGAIQVGNTTLGTENL
jgi:hypothetical protein